MKKSFYDDYEILTKYIQVRYNKNVCAKSPKKVMNANSLLYLIRKDFRKRHVLLPSDQDEAFDFLSTIIDDEYLENLLANYLGDYNEDTTELYRTGCMKDVAEEIFQMKLSSKYIGLYKNNINVVCTCGTPALFVLRSSVFQKGAGSKMIYYCPHCKNRVGVHAGTNIPLGTMADAETAKLRKMCHDVFDEKWNTPEQRDIAYRKLANAMNLTYSKAHFGKFTKEQCKMALKILGEKEV